MIDFYEINDPGCCLVCLNSYEGCLCYNCKCKKCEWYEQDWNGKGHCGLTDIWKQERKQKWEEEQEKKRLLFAVNAKELNKDYSRLGLDKDQKQLFDSHKKGED